MFLKWLFSVSDSQRTSRTTLGRSGKTGTSGRRAGGIRGEFLLCFKMENAQGFYLLLIRLTIWRRNLLEGQMELLVNEDLRRSRGWLEK